MKVKDNFASWTRLIFLGVEDLGVEDLSLNKAQKLAVTSSSSVDSLCLNFLLYATTKSL